MTRCLVIDDHRAMRKVERGILEDLDFEAVEAEDSESALAYCRAEMPELILLDIDLPNTSGFEFLRKLKQQPSAKSPLVVFCTTENDVDRISQALVAGAHDFVQKPFDREDLKGTLAAHGLV